MSITDYLINGFLVALILLQVRGRRITVRTLLLPLVVVAVVAASYLHGIPTVGNDLYLELGGAFVGLALGAGCGLATAVLHREDGSPIAKAGLLAALLWVAGVGARMGFALYATHGGEHAIGDFSATHHLTAEAWVAALILMALVEVSSRTAVLAFRYWRLQSPAAPLAAGVGVVGLHPGAAGRTIMDVRGDRA